jgi:prolyl-tRNA editing enzyme YbaK/EbsC (Cys-tRNA(Pro) deacylase)
MFAVIADCKAEANMRKLSVSAAALSCRRYLSDLLRLASEQEFCDLFPDCELGAMPPIGSLYNLSVYVDESLAADEMIVFNAGTHRDAIRIRYADFVGLVKPNICSFAKKG